MAPKHKSRADNTCKSSHEFILHPTSVQLEGRVWISDQWAQKRKMLECGSSPRGSREKGSTLFILDSYKCYSHIRILYSTPPDLSDVVQSRSRSFSIKVYSKYVQLYCTERLSKMSSSEYHSEISYW